MCYFVSFERKHPSPERPPKHPPGPVFGLLGKGAGESRTSERGGKR